MARPLHIIASCTERKREAVPAALRLRTIREIDVEARARSWWERLQAAEQPTVVAEDLYAGDHWCVVRELPIVAGSAGYKVCLWVASAGYGLIPAEASIRPYSATFARGHEDSVARGGSQDQSSANVLRQWWKALAAQESPIEGAERSVQMLAEAAPRSSILVVASPSYVAALSEDIGLAAQKLTRPESLLVVSAPSPLLTGELAAHWVPSTAHLQARMGGSRLSLHARVARDILERAEGRPLDATEVRTRYQRIIRRSPPPRRYERQPMTDDEVRAFIVEAIGDGVRSWSAGLRLLRSRQLACEQSRFRRIFKEMRERA